MTRRVTIHDYGQNTGPTEIRVSSVANPPRADEKPGTVLSCNRSTVDPSSVPGQPLDGFVTFGQGAFLVLGSVSRKRKNNTGEGNG